MDLELRGRVAVVTGSSAGLGRAIAKALAAEGVQTIIVARRLELLHALQVEIVQAGGLRPMAISVDLADRSETSKISDEVLNAFGTIDILVNNAGGSRKLPMDAPDDAWDDAFAVNFTAVRKLTQAFLPAMIQRRWGRIINVTGSMEPSSVNGANAAKAGVHAWAKGLSREIGKYNVTINSLIPGRIHSEQIDQRVHPTAESQAEFAKNIPLGSFGDPEDLAFVAACLCSPKARYVTGERIHVDGGLHRFL